MSHAKNVTPEYAASFVVETFRVARDQEFEALERARKLGRSTHNHWDRYRAACACVEALQHYADLVVQS